MKLFFLEVRKFSMDFMEKLSNVKYYSEMEILKI